MTSRPRSCRTRSWRPRTRSCQKGWKGNIRISCIPTARSRTRLSSSLPWMSRASSTSSLRYPVERQDMASIPVLGMLLDVAGVVDELTARASSWISGIEWANDNDGDRSAEVEAAAMEILGDEQTADKKRASQRSPSSQSWRTGCLIRRRPKLPRCPGSKASEIAGWLTRCSTRSLTPIRNMRT
ncbi:hypothetical protein EMEDMD4_800005 [Sinorhizobium medicae]|uniref:Uncharacterized protein n=1 Tax=Sinorhizobium medicae TaxID=110321 RepID=A0A508XAY2_9HYPH|nr:hypothetical protein EMEDMD4_800005 [Sinorhizobium medicae]